MNRVYVLFERCPMDNIFIETIGVITREKIAEQWSNSDSNYPNLLRTYQTIEINDPELLNRIAKESTKIETEEIYNQLKDINKSKPYKGAIKIPCSPCGDGDKNLEYHNHEHVSEINRD